MSLLSEQFGRRDHEGLPISEGRPDPPRVSPAGLVAIGVAGNVLAYGMMAALSRVLTVTEFEAYVLAVSSFLVLVAAAPLGATRYTLRALPPLLERQEWNTVRGYLAFALRRGLIGSALVSGLVLGWALLVRDVADPTRSALLVACLALPFGVAAGIGIEALTAFGRPLLAAVLYRIGPVLLAVAGLATWTIAGGRPSATAAIAAWGFGLAAASVGMAAMLATMIPSGLAGARSYDSEKWRRGAQPFFLYRLGVAAMAQASIIGLAWLHPSPTAVAAYAAAYSTANLAMVLVGATNRAYVREMSLLIDRRDMAGLTALHRVRIAWLLPVLLVLVAVVLMAPKAVLGLFGPDLASEGASALRILAVSTAIVMLFSLVPTCLKHCGLHAPMFRVIGAAFIVQAVGLLALVPPLGATGAALAHALGSVSFVAGVVWVAANWKLRLERHVR